MYLLGGKAMTTVRIRLPKDKTESSTLSCHADTSIKEDRSIDFHENETRAIRLPKCSFFPYIPMRNGFPIFQNNLHRKGLSILQK